MSRTGGISQREYDLQGNEELAIQGQEELEREEEERCFHLTL